MLDAIPDDAVGRALKATMHYFATGEILPLGQLEMIVFSAFKVNVDEALDDYQRRSEIGKNGGKAKKAVSKEPMPSSAKQCLAMPGIANQCLPVPGSANQCLAIPTEGEGEEEGDKEGEEEGEREDRDFDSHTFSPPSVKEVYAFCQEMGFGIDAERFVDYYTATGWRIGSTPISDWKAVVKNWNRKERKNGNLTADDKAEAGSLWPVIGTVV